MIARTVTVSVKACVCMVLQHRIYAVSYARFVVANACCSSENGTACK